MSKPYPFTDKLFWLWRQTFPSATPDGDGGRFAPRSKAFLEAVKPARLLFVGDIMRTHRERVPEMSTPVREVFARSHRVYANCEGPVVHRLTESRPLLTVRYGLAREYLERIARSTETPLDRWRFSLANNHAGDFGEEGVRSTMRIMDGTGAIFYGLAGQTLRDVVGDVRFDVQGWTEWENREFEGSPDWRPSTSIASPRRTGASARSEYGYLSDERVFQILTPHWGREFRHFPDGDQLTRMHGWLHDGFDLVVGHHSHVVQPIEVVTSVENRTQIGSYSVGNFLGAQWSWPTRLLGALEVEVETIGENAGRIVRYEMHGWVFRRGKIETLIESTSTLDRESARFEKVLSAAAYP